MLEWLEQYLAEILLVAGLVVSFAVQLLLCFRVRRVWLRLIPLFGALLYAAVCLVLIFTAKDLMVLVYLLFLAHSGLVLGVCALAWLLWALSRLLCVAKRRAVESESIQEE